jgi:Ca2+-binding EF-hand superfamily protein
LGASASSPRRTVEQPQHRLELEAIFRLIDEDDSGSISVEEFVAALSKDDTDQVGEMSFGAFAMSIFELADHWSTEDSVAAYVRILRAIFR